MKNLRIRTSLSIMQGSTPNHSSSSTKRANSTSLSWRIKHRMTISWWPKQLTCSIRVAIVQNCKVYSITSTHRQSTLSMENFSISRCISSMVWYLTANRSPNSATVFWVSYSRQFQMILSSHSTVKVSTMTDSWRECLLSQWVKRKHHKNLWTSPSSSHNWDTIEDGPTPAPWQRLLSRRAFFGMF